MKLVFSDKPLPTSVTSSIFLAGPSPRRKEIKDWRPDAVKHLKKLGYTGTVFIPRWRSAFYNKSTAQSFDYDFQIEWECQARAMADRIVFWLARDIKGEMPAFVTNFELGEDLASGKVVYGRPSTAEKCSYMDKRLDMLNQVYYTDLQEMLKQTVTDLGDGAKRKNGETQVPLDIWRTKQFTQWYKALIKSGNRLDGADIKSVVRLPNGVIFSYTLKAKIWVAAENRYKENEFVFARPDISSVLPYYKDKKGKVHIALVKEFRSPVRNSEGYVIELPSGSSKDTTELAQVNAQHELEEECGLRIEDISRFVEVNTRQLMATLSSHVATLYKVKLTKAEYKQIKRAAKNGDVNGVIEDSEQTSVVMCKLSNVFKYGVDYSTLGMLFEVFNS